MDTFLYDHGPLLRFLNESLSVGNWQKQLQDVEAWQLEWWLGLDADKEECPKINGVPATLEAARELQASLRRELTELAHVCLDRQRLAKEAEAVDYGRGGSRVWTWRKASVLPTRQLFFEDAGEALNFLAEELEYKIKKRFKASNGPRRKRDREWTSRPLHLALCACGCEQFFLWVGNWRQKRRKYLDDTHRMRFHNARNVEQKRLLARRQRVQGNPSYF